MPVPYSSLNKNNHDKVTHCAYSNYY